MNRDADGPPAGGTLVLLERILFVAALACLGWYGAAHVATARDRAAGLQELAEGLARPPSESVALTGMRPDRDAAGDNGARAAARRAPLPHGTLIGRIDIPRLGLSEVLRSGDDDATLERAVGHLPDTPLPGQGGNAAFAAHRDTHFRPLRNIREGDRIVVTTMDGRYEYVVTDLRVVPPTEVSVLDPTPESALTLVTCHPFNFVGAAPNRFIVRALAASPDS